MSQNQPNRDLSPITVRDFATTLRVLRTLEEFQRMQHMNIPNMVGSIPTFKSPLAPAISAVTHFADWLPRITPSAPCPNRTSNKHRKSKGGASRG